MRTPKPNEIWETNEGRMVLVVQHPMSEVQGNLGFIWYDEIDGTMNFSPLEDQLREPEDCVGIAAWGALMQKLSDPVAEDEDDEDCHWYVQDDEGKMHGPYPDYDDACCVANQIDGIIKKG